MVDYFGVTCQNFSEVEVIAQKRWPICLVFCASTSRFVFTGDHPTYGKYPGVFDYQFDFYPGSDPIGHYWALLLWEKIIGGRR
jgi:hypothetical protein